MKKNNNYIDMPWSLEEDAKIVIAVQGNALLSLELPGRSLNQIIRRKRSAMLRFDRGELSKYVVNKREEEERKERERRRKMQQERIPSFERPKSELVKLNERAEMLLTRMEETSPLSPEFAQVVKEYHNVEIKLKSFYFNEQVVHKQKMRSHYNQSF